MPSGRTMTGQMSLSDYSFNVNNGFQNFHEHCVHRGWFREADEEHAQSWMCGCQNGHMAQSWNDWVECSEQNCWLVKGV